MAYTHLHAYGHPELLANDAFRAYLKAQCPDTELDCWFNLHTTRDVVKDGKRYRFVGAWAIWEKKHVAVRKRVGDMTVVVGIDRWCDIMVLDGGLLGLPLTLGRWVVAALRHSDVTRRKGGAAERAAELDALNEADQLKQYAMQDRITTELGESRDYKRAAAKLDAHLGSPVLSGDEKAAIRKIRDKREKKGWSAAEREAKLFRFFGR